MGIPTGGNLRKNGRVFALFAQYGLGFGFGCDCVSLTPSSMARQHSPQQ
jgi:hypothetical protein